jgi:competence protein ComEC
MPHKLLKILLILSIIGIVAALTIYWISDRQPRQLELFFLDVGQGDGELIKSPGGQNILIDGGPDKIIMSRLAEALPAYDRTIDLMILTHPHDDHVAGLIEVVKNYQVKKILYTGVAHTSPNYISWLEEVKNKKIPLIIIERAQEIRLDNETVLKILYPRKNLMGRDVKFLNNSSIVARLKYKNFTALFMGDAENPVEDEMIDSFENIGARVIKIGHHGSDTSSSDKFIRAVSPEAAIISAGANNQFGLPSPRTIKRLERENIKIFRTDLSGTIKITSDGEKYLVSPAKQ